jgi:hypothetical protein
MSYIKPDQFFKQSKEIQQLFLDCWKPEVGDLIGIKIEYVDWSWNTAFKYKVNCINENDIFEYDSKKNCWIVSKLLDIIIIQMKLFLYLQKKC